MMIGLGLSLTGGQRVASFSLSDLFASGTYDGFWYDASDISTLFQDTSAATPVTASTQVVGRANDKSPSGNNATQGTTSYKPIYTESGGVKYLNYDGIDDESRSTLVPAASMTLAICARSTSAGGVLIGSNAAADTRSFIGLNSSGQLGGGVGADSFTTITGGADLRGTDFVGLLRYNDTTVELWLDGERIYQGALNGVPNTSVAYALGGYNNNGTVSNFSAARAYRAVGVQRFIPDAYVIPTMRALGSGVVSI